MCVCSDHWQCGAPKPSWAHTHTHTTPQTDRQSTHRCVCVLRMSQRTHLAHTVPLPVSPHPPDRTTLTTKMDTRRGHPRFARAPSCDPSRCTLVLTGPNACVTRLSPLRSACCLNAHARCPRSLHARKRGARQQGGEVGRLGHELRRGGGDLERLLDGRE